MLRNRPSTLAALLTLAVCLTLTSCDVTLGPKAERQTVWAQMGTPGRVVDDATVELLVEVDGQLKRSRARIQGMIVLDEPTYTALMEAYKASKPKGTTSL